MLGYDFQNNNVRENISENIVSKETLVLATGNQHERTREVLSCWFPVARTNVSRKVIVSNMSPRPLVLISESSSGKRMVATKLNNLNT